jgi:(1->4)-alpha-D-glucan 1-alpha-D-glucosylmutase
MSDRPTPRATYRLQLSREFTFAQAERLVPYLHALGISHVYASPCLKARSGSLHGYDIVDHNSLNPEIGSREEFESFIDTLHGHGMGLILDLVPNHMGIAGDENAWWRDVLENGQASPYAAYFDIDWHPIRETLRGKVLLPVLSDHYGKVLESGELGLEFDRQRGEFAVRYYDRRFPVDPETYPLILNREIERLAALAAEEAHTLTDWHELCADLERLRSLRPTPIERSRAASGCKQRLATLCGQSPSVPTFIEEKLAAFNGIPGQPESFDLLHGLLESQSFRLAYWRVALHEINYRRFFDINELVCLRQENPEVFDATHRLVLALIADGSVDGLRIDHPDGLYDPRDYFRRLQSEVGRITQDAANGGDEPPLYMVAEKILAGYEHLREDWPVAGTTGYEFANLVNGLFVYAGAEKELTRIYARYTGETAPFDEVLYDRKRRIIGAQMASEMGTLVNLLYGIAQSNRSTRDYTVNGLRDALTEVVACFPVYRTYITAGGITEEDRRFVVWAIAQAKKRSPAADITIFDFIQGILLSEYREDPGAEYAAKVLQFTRKFQQYAAPAMAKGMEDTAFYVYNRLVSLNEVGGDPRRFGVTPAAFHYANQQRLRHWPKAMINTATHDSKRSGDMRLRVDVISEVPDEWRFKVFLWRRLNRNKKMRVDDQPAPSRNDEYLLYQTLLGAWPLDSPEGEDLEPFRARIEAYMLKAAREAKIHTSWINPNEGYERAVMEFVRALLDRKKSRVFLDDFSRFQRRIARFGLLSGLSQTLLHLTSPGVPDIYQGTEGWSFTLVDPDNRRPVDFEQHRDALEALRRTAGKRAAPEFLRDMLQHIEDGRAKLFVTWKALAARTANPELFARGDYLPLEARGERAEHLVAFTRRYENCAIAVVAARWFVRLLRGQDLDPTGEAVWGDTQIQLPDDGKAYRLLDLLRGAEIGTVESNGGRCLPAGEVLRHFPVALLFLATGNFSSNTGPKVSLNALR